METLYKITEGNVETFATCYTGHDILRERLSDYYTINESNDSVLVLACDKDEALALSQKYDNNVIDIDNCAYNDVTVPCLSQ